MRRARPWSILMLALVWGGVLLFPATAWTQGGSGNPRGVNQDSHTGKDVVSITKITPRTAADIPTPARLPFSLEVSYDLRTAASGKLRVGVFRWLPGSATRRPAPGKLAPGLEALTTPVERSIKKGTDVVNLTTPPVVLNPAKGINSQVIVVVHVQDSAGKELCWATSYNFLRGTLSAKQQSSAPRSDTLQVLSYLPRPGKLQTGQGVSFTVNLKYQLKSADWGFINLELGEPSLDPKVPTTTPYYTMVVPVSKGVGSLSIKTRDIFLPVSLAGRQLKLALPYRVKPLGGTVDIPTAGTWELLQQGG